MVVIAVGNAFDGLVFYGPFDDSDAATAYAEEFLRNQEWHIVELLNPEVDE